MSTRTNKKNISITQGSMHIRQLLRHISLSFCLTAAFLSSAFADTTQDASKPSTPQKKRISKKTRIASKKSGAAAAQRKADAEATTPSPAREVSTAPEIATSTDLASATASAPAVATPSPVLSNNLDSQTYDEQWVDTRKVILPNTISDLATALAAAYENSQALQGKRREMLAAHQEVAKKKAGFLPTVDLQGNISASTSHTRNGLQGGADAAPTDTWARSLGATATISQNLFAGGATLASISSADKAVRGQWATLLSTEQEIFSNVIKAYLDLIAKQSKTEVQKAYRASMQKSYDTSFEKHKIGEETITQVALAESRLMAADAQLRSAEADVVGALAAFSGLTSSAPHNLKKPSAPTGLPDTLQKSIDIALANHPQIIAARFAHDSAKADIDTANAELYSPKLDLQASTTRSASLTKQGAPSFNGNGPYTITNSWSQPSSSQIGLAMSYQLYSGGKYSAQRRAAHDKALAKRFEIEDLKTQVVVKLKSTFETAQAAKTNINNYNKQVKAAEIAVESTYQEMSVGTKVLNDVLEAESKLVQAKLGAIEAENTYLTAAYQMVALLGGLHAKALQLNVPYFDPQKHYDEMPVGY